MIPHEKSQGLRYSRKRDNFHNIKGTQERLIATKFFFYICNPFFNKALVQEFWGPYYGCRLTNTQTYIIPFQI